MKLASIRNPPSELLSFTAAQTAERLNMNITTFYRRVWNDEIRPMKLSGNMRFSEPEIQRFLNKTVKHEKNPNRVTVGEKRKGGKAGE